MDADLMMIPLEPDECVDLCDESLALCDCKRNEILWVYIHILAILQKSLDRAISLCIWIAKERLSSMTA